MTARASSGVSESIHPAWTQKKIEEEELSSRRSVTSSSSGTNSKTTKSRTSGRGNLRGNDDRRDDREVDDEDEVAAVARRSRCCGVIWTGAKDLLVSLQQRYISDGLLVTREGNRLKDEL